jgi:hypothetical protein
MVDEAKGLPNLGTTGGYAKEVVFAVTAPCGNSTDNAWVNHHPAPYERDLLEPGAVQS